MKKTKLQEMRLKREINQEIMSNLVNMTQATYSRKERGLTSITPEEWDKIAEVLEVDKFEIYEGNLRSNISSGNLRKHKTNIPPDLLKQIEDLKKENLKLKEQIKKLKGKNNS